MSMTCHAQAEKADADYFEQHVRPLLAKRCFSCHGEKKQESDLRLDARASILQGGASGEPAAVSGNPAASLIAKYTRREAEGMEMPPDEPLSKSELAVIERWIRDGLAWPEEVHPSASTMQQRFNRDRATHWAFQAPKISPPVNADWPADVSNWPLTQTDQFVLDKLVARNMRPAPEADRRTLIRRLKFNLLGIPPTPEEVKTFIDDSSPDAWQRAVDRYLASPHYGERWGRHWLDVARYSDTRGYTFGGADRNYPWAYTYRDYVINAFNLDLPYDQFVVEQLAADQLDLGEDNRALAALGFMTVGRKFNNAHDDIDDKIDAVTRGFQGLTVACARCHDHKYDAIPTEDYYSLYGVFSSSQEPGDLPLIGDAAILSSNLEYEARFNAADRKLKEYESRLLGEITNHAHTKLTEYLVAAATNSKPTDLRPYLVEAWMKLLRKKAQHDEPTLMPWFRLHSVADAEFANATAALATEIKEQAGDFLNPFVRQAFIDQPPTSKQEMAELYGRVLQDAYKVWQEAGGDNGARRKQSAEIRQLLWYYSDGNSPAKIEQGKIDKYLAPNESNHRQCLQADVDVVRKTIPVAYHRAMVLRDKASPSNANVFVRGSSRRPGKQVPRQSPLLIAAERQVPYQQGSGRLDLARDIVSKKNPLTARVMVNRIWMHHFGRPLVDTPSDFGIRCEPPLQQDLLDYLSLRFMQNDWSIKSLHREILMSATYRQASIDRPNFYKVDPENRLLWRMNRRRLEFEVMRDAILAASRRLDTTLGGKPVRMFRKLDSGTRRSVYGYIDRQDLPNLLRVFDFAGPDQSAAKRALTTVPQQSLFMLNSPFVILQAREVADSLVDLNDEDYINALYERLLARTPEAIEKQICNSLLTGSSENASKFGPRAQLAQLLLLMNEFCYVD